ncbi:MAG: aminopeptidase N [Gammaproteobacteria bacterium]|nr:aminopeptidase N [Gammaproteobacteria bacterium]
MSLTNTSESQTHYLEDYQVPDFLCNAIFLHFELHEDHTAVHSVMHLQRNPNSQSPDSSLVLNGEGMDLETLLLDGTPIISENYRVDKESLTVDHLPIQFILETIVRIKPHENFALSGLYKSRNNYCTQCESHGFRRITYFLDRPDVMTKFTVTISADKKRYPLLLSNGNLVEEKELSNGRHWVKWEDPSLKPSYLFALVAGDLDLLQDQFITRSGRKVDLRLYVEKGNLDQASYSMESLKNAMRWDEQTFGCEYDLDIYMIVAVSDFNMGAMENKGLNIFNDKYILAKPDTATDEDYVLIESVIGHEYFHNWSGNRVTVRDWFQITLKEGLTIFRDQSFTTDHTLGDVKRIQDVNVIRNAQFAQDAGPMAHSIRPHSYIEVNNFYTVTVYNKGSEVIRMQQTLLGKEKFTKAMETYFHRFDGMAVTTEDFVNVMSEVGEIDLTQFKLWYEQAGTPILTFSDSYDASSQTYTLRVQQFTPPTPGQSEKLPFHIPIKLGLLDASGQDIALQLTDESSAAGTQRVLNLTQSEQTFYFVNVKEKPVPSLLRSFSAPVKVNYPYTDSEFIFLMRHDSDGFNRWDAGQQYFIRTILALVDDYQKNKPLSLGDQFVEAVGAVLSEDSLDNLLKAEMLILPGISYLIECMTVADVAAIHHVREFIKKELAVKLSTMWQKCYTENALPGEYTFSHTAMGHRRMRNLALHYLILGAQQGDCSVAIQHFEASNNLTDRLGALEAINAVEGKERDRLLAAFFDRYQRDHLVIDKWFRLQAIAPLDSTLDQVNKLLKHSAFDMKNPNKVRALVGSFASLNPVCFHASDGNGYEFLANIVMEVDKFNPQVAARLIEPLIRWRKFGIKVQGLMKASLETVANHPALSKDVGEIVVKSLK